MKKISFLFILFFFHLFSAHASADKIDDIRFLVLKEDFVKARETSIEFLSRKENRDYYFEEPTYYVALSNLYLGDYDDALKGFKIVSRNSKSLDLRDQASIGEINAYYLKGHYNEALKKAKNLLRQRPDSNFLSTIYLKIARSNLKLAHWDSARKTLHRIVGEFPDSLEAFTAKQLLDEKKYFTVQIGAFLDQKRAEKLVRELRLKGQYGYIVETKNQNDQKFYRVRIGELISLDKAKRLKSELANIGYPTMIYP